MATAFQAAALAVAMLIGGVDSRSVIAADAPLPAKLQRQVDTAVTRGVAWLQAQDVAAGSAEASLICYALLKAHVPAEQVLIVRHQQALLASIAEGKYSKPAPPKHHIYEAGCDAMFLEALDPGLYAPQLTEIRDYLIAKQLSSGAWFYPTLPSGPAGDTSITQYGALGLWAIHRARIDVPRDVWSKTAKYFSATQRNDGGFAYHPYEGGVTTASMTAAGLGTVLLTELLLYGDADKKPVPVLQRRFGVLEQLADDQTESRKAARKTEGESLVSRDALKKMFPGAKQSVARQFENGLKGPHPIYFLYGCERAGAISGEETFGDVKWYEKGAEFLVERQDNDGGWRVSTAYEKSVDTAFAVLFLTRATQSLVNRPKPKLVAGGLLVGGRGLPEDLQRVTVQGGEVESRLPKGEVDELLSQLEQPADIALPEVQQAIVEKVSLENPEALVGQIDRLRTLSRHPQADVRQVAAWALARSGDYREAPRLIAMLDDPDLVVAWEASLGLCVLSRQPSGITPRGASAPLPVQPPGVNAEEPDPKLADEWRRAARAAWDAWYQSVRPYDERDDRRQIRNR